MQQRRFLARTVVPVATVLLACLALGGCETQLKKAKSELLELSDLLPGRYNNVAQSEEDAKEGRDVHAAVTLDIVRVDIPLLADYVFYLQESAANDAGRITTQRLLTFEASDDGRITEKVYSFAQPARWRDGNTNPGLFTSMMFRDTTPLGGCDLAWKKEGGKFLGQNSRETCRVNSPALGTVKVDMRAELTPEDLSLAELSYNAAGKLVQGHAGEPFNRFQRAGGP